MDALDYYSGQSPVTDPGGMSRRLADLPSDLAGLQRIVRGLVLHYRADDPSAHGVPDERLSEIDSRYADVMLGRVFELDGRPLSDERAPRDRLLGCCRDFTVLFLAATFRLGIPARARVGFATYFVPGFNIDHEVAEVWDPAEGRWRLVDAELDDGHVDPTDGARVDPLDVPRDRFVVAGAAWRACRGGDADPQTFLVAPDLDIELTRGWSYLRHNLVHDLAALNKIEMILWDYWGLMEQDRLSAGEEELLDRVAEMTVSADASFSELRRAYENEPALRVPRTVTSYSPAVGGPVEVALER